MSSAGVATTRVLQTQPRQVSSSLASGTATSITLGATTSLTPASSAAVVSQVGNSDLIYVIHAKHTPILFESLTNGFKYSVKQVEQVNNNVLTFL